MGILAWEVSKARIVLVGISFVNFINVFDNLKVMPNHLLLDILNFVEVFLIGSSTILCK